MEFNLNTQTRLNFASAIHFLLNIFNKKRRNLLKQQKSITKLTLFFRVRELNGIESID